jgi:hypothetical protein
MLTLPQVKEWWLNSSGARLAAPRAELSRRKPSSEAPPTQRFFLMAHDDRISLQPLIPQLVGTKYDQNQPTCYTALKRSTLC